MRKIGGTGALEGTLGQGPKRRLDLSPTGNAIDPRRLESNKAGRTHITNGPSIPRGPGRPHNCVDQGSTYTH